MGTKTVVGALSGIALQPEVTELVLGRARVYRNPLWPAEAWSSELLPHFELRERHDPGAFPLLVAKFLIDLEFDWPKEEIPTSLISEQLETAALPLKLGTEGRILVSFARIGGGGRAEVSSEGLRVRSPLMGGTHQVAVLDSASCAALTTLAQVVADLDLGPFKVPLECFSDSFHRVRSVDRGIDLLVALEALFSEGPESIALKVALRSACLMETSAQGRKKIYSLVREAYKHRNTLVHGSPKRRSAVDWFEQHNDELESVVRKSICCYIKMLASGKRVWPGNIDEFLFDSKLLEATEAAAVQPFQPVGTRQRFWYSP